MDQPMMSISKIKNSTTRSRTGNAVTSQLPAANQPPLSRPDTRNMPITKIHILAFGWWENARTTNIMAINSK